MRAIVPDGEMPNPRDDKPNGLLVEMYEDMVEMDDIVDIIEVDNSLYTISCIEER